MNEQALLEALRAAMRASPKGEGVTHAELRTALGTSDIATRTALRKLIASGIVSPVRTYRKAMDGIMRPVSAYCLAPKKR